MSDYGYLRDQPPRSDDADRYIERLEKELQQAQEQAEAETTNARYWHERAQELEQDRLRLDRLEALGSLVPVSSGEVVVWWVRSAPFTGARPSLRAALDAFQPPGV